MKKRSIRTLLLRALMLLMGVTLGLSFSGFFVMQYITLKQHATADMQSNCSSIASSLEQYIKEMDTILLYSIASSELKQNFSDYMNADSSFEKNRARQKLAGTMIALKGFDFSIRQLNMYGYDGGGYGVGNFNGDLPDVTLSSWYDKTTSLSGRKNIYAPALNEKVSRSAGVPEDTPYLSLSRMVYGDMHIPLGYLEVEAYYNEVFDNFGYSSGGVRPTVVIYDTDGHQLYPETEVFPYFDHKDVSTNEIRNTFTGQKQYLCFSEDTADGLVVAMAVDNSVFMEPVYRSLIPIVILVFVIFIICVFLVATLSKRLSDPIRRMYAFLSNTQKDRSVRLELADSGVREIDKLRDTINENIQMQDQSTRTMLSLKEQEMQARMLALQSQMNPHFLYNSLSMIGEMAENGENGQVSDMCSDITSILRYISSDSKQRIRVEEEMEQVDTYLRCMKRRFGDGLDYSYDIEDDILDRMIPKLCVQMLVENSIKAIMEHRAPWNIDIKSKRNGDDWNITVYDNGPGFDPEVEKALRSNMDIILETGVLPSLKIEGMGILNIFIRLYLLDGIPFVFDFGNRNEGGAFVTVGGHINDEERSL